VQRFDFRFAPAYRLAARPFGITPERAWVQVDDEHLLANYGPWRLRTPLGNVRRVAITGPYRFYRTAGPARLGITDGGLTFASNGERGVLLSFRERVPAIDPFGLIRHPELTVTVADVRGLLGALGADRWPPTRCLQRCSWHRRACVVADAVAGRPAGWRRSSADALLPAWRRR
jgi:hypothetical protein